MRSLLHFFFFLLAMTGLTCLQSCDDNDSVSSVPVELPQRTVLVYMAADNSLNTYAEDDLKEMVAGMEEVEGEESNLLVFVDKGGAFSAKSPFADVMCASLIKIENVKGKVRHRVLKTYGDESEDFNACGKAETLQVMSDAFALYPAESFGLVYWSHGDGWIPAEMPDTRWIGQDKDGNVSRYTNIDDLVEVLSQLPHLDFLLFDACFMQTIEVAYALRNFVDYIIASPAEIPGPGSPYQTTVPAMFSGKEVTDIAEAYFRYYDDLYTGKITTGNPWNMGTAISVIATAPLESLAQATKRAVSNLGEVSSADLRADNTLLDYDTQSFSSRSRFYIGYYDLWEVMRRLLSDEAFSRWQSTFDAVQPYWETTEKVYSGISVSMFPMKDAHGISCYVPKNSNGAIAVSFHRTDWYRDAGLDALGW